MDNVSGPAAPMTDAGRSARRARWVWLACAVVAAGWVPNGSLAASKREPLRIRVTPAIAQPPAFVTVRADVDAHDDNRSLEVTAEGDQFRASSQVPLEGSKGPRFTEIYFDNLPAGSYTVTVVLNGSTGQRARATRSVLVGAPPDGPQP